MFCSDRVKNIENLNLFYHKNDVLFWFKRYIEAISSLVLEKIFNPMRNTSDIYKRLFELTVNS